MDKQQMQSAMHEKMREMCADMSSDEKTEMMMGMMEKMKEGIDFDQMMSKEKSDGMKDIMAKMMEGGEGHERQMPEIMLSAMMPHCIGMMMPKVAKEKRADVARGLIAAVMEQATKDMSAEEKTAFVGKVVLSMNA